VTRVRCVSVNRDVYLFYANAQHSQQFCRLPVSAIITHIHYKELTNTSYHIRYISLGKRKRNEISFPDKYIDYFIGFVLRFRRCI